MLLHALDVTFVLDFRKRCSGEHFADCLTQADRPRGDRDIRDVSP